MMAALEVREGAERSRRGRSSVLSGGSSASASCELMMGTKRYQKGTTHLLLVTALPFSVVLGRQ